MSHPALGVALIVASLLGCALVIPTRFSTRRTLLTAALVLGLGIAAASGIAWWNGDAGVQRTTLLTDVTLSSVVLMGFATTPPMGGKWCGSSAGVIIGAVIMAVAMIASEVL